MSEMDCDKCPIRKECKDEKEHALAIFVPVYKGISVKNYLKEKLGKFCPLEGLVNKIRTYAQQQVILLYRAIDEGLRK